MCTHFKCIGYFKCPHSFCLPLKYICDGKNDCPEGEDEVNCIDLYPADLAKKIDDLSVSIEPFSNMKTKLLSAIQSLSDTQNMIKQELFLIRNKQDSLESSVRSQKTINNWNRKS